MNSKGNIKTIISTLIGATVLIFVGFLFLSSSSTDSTGLLFVIGLIFVIATVIALILWVLRGFKGGL